MEVDTFLPFWVTAYHFGEKDGEDVFNKTLIMKSVIEIKCLFTEEAKMLPLVFAAVSVFGGIKQRNWREE